MSKPLYVSNPEQWLQENVHGPDLFGIVIFRGSWCKYDKYYLRKLGHFLKTVKEDVTLVAWTSEGEAGAKKADEEWGLTKDCGYKMVIGDDTNALANHLVDDVVLEHLKTATPAEAKVQDLVQEGSYPNGIVMPGMVWYAHHGNLVFQWCSPFEEPGLGGPDRPEPNDFWNHLLRRKFALDQGSAVMPIHGEDLKMCTNDFEVTLSQCDIL